MEIQTIEGLYPASNRMVVRTTTTFHRYLYELIKWNACMIGIKGARGVGKTTMLLQRIKEEFHDSPEKALYVSLDNRTWQPHSIMDVWTFVLKQKTI